MRTETLAHSFPMCLAVVTCAVTVYADLLEAVVFSRPPVVKSPTGGVRVHCTLPRTEAPPQLEGKLEDPCWRLDKARLGQFHIGWSKVPAKHAREAWAVFDDANLYFAVKLQREPGKALRVLTRDADNGQIWKDDELEVFLDPFATGTQYYQLIFNSAGVLYDARHRLRLVPDPRGVGPSDLKRVRDTDTAWTSRARCAVGIQPGFWVLEVAIPLEALGLTGAPAGHTVRFNLTSADWDTNEYTCLSPVSDWHDPAQFAALTLGAPRVAVEALDLGEVGTGSNLLRVRAKSLGDSLAGGSLRLRFATVAGSTTAETQLDLNAEATTKAQVSFETRATEGAWAADVRLFDSAGRALYAARRLGSLRPPLEMQFLSRAAFTDGGPRKVVGRLGFGEGSLSRLEVRARLLNAAGVVVRQQLLGAPTGPLLTADMPVAGLETGTYQLVLEVREGGRPLAEATDSLRLGLSPFATAVRPGALP